VPCWLHVAVGCMLTAFLDCMLEHGSGRSLAVVVGAWVSAVWVWGCVGMWVCEYVRV
jgi:hypothetical protein